jgi:hypothetical protein
MPLRASAFVPERATMLAQRVRRERVDVIRHVDPLLARHTAQTGKHPLGREGRFAEANAGRFI